MAELIAAEHSLCPRSAVPPVAPPCPNPPHCRRDLPDHPARDHLFTRVVADVGRRGGRRGARGGLSSPPLRVDSGAAMLRATRPGGGRRGNLDLVLRRSGWLGLLSQRPG